MRYINCCYHLKSSKRDDAAWKIHLVQYDVRYTALFHTSLFLLSNDKKKFIESSAAFLSLEMDFFYILFLLLHFLSLVYCNNFFNHWQNLSEQKVIKCQNDKCFNWNRSLEKIFKTDTKKNQVVISYKCNLHESPIEFTFKGKVEDFKLEGPGKLRIINKTDSENQR